MSGPWRDYLLAGCLGAVVGVAILYAFRDRILPPPLPRAVASVATASEALLMPEEAVVPIVAVEVTRATTPAAPTTTVARSRRASPRAIIRGPAGVQVHKDPKTGVKQLVVDPFPEEGAPRQGRNKPAKK